MYILRKLIFVLLSFFIYCTNVNDLYYSAGEANARILVAFAIKDAECKYTHRVTAFIPGEARKTEITACTQAILTKLCGEWNVTDPTPLLCKTINYRNNYKLRGI
ncbi:MAG TPA: hypothetical protein PLP33_02190 [Leptospiraceae bacterium]|nr:hypothetical protein [Leptospiraceae bacterium]HNC54227.1 hypothetical protein [Leptospiraceae bacterium]HNG98810.1 hypothetical protein [Leptospiraceae bacterium]HNK92464.1 hypothetical protein [Leptospiraceae bacterium]